VIAAKIGDGGRVHTVAVKIWREWRRPGGASAEEKILPRKKRGKCRHPRLISAQEVKKKKPGAHYRGRVKGCWISELSPLRRSAKLLR